MNKRHLAREAAFKILYQWELSGIPDSDAQLGNDVDKHFLHFNTPGEVQEFCRELVLGTVRSLSTLDEKIQSRSANWRLDRMSPVDRSLLRLAAFEVLILKSAPVPVVINETLELAKLFGTEQSSSFINGVLDSVFREKPTES
jgi:transcription antitermination protein NusB